MPDDALDDVPDDGPLEVPSPQEDLSTELLREFGIRDLGLRAWIIETIGLGDLLEKHAHPPELLARGWRCAYEPSASHRWTWVYPDYVWIPPSGSYVALGYRKEPYDGLTTIRENGGYRLSAKVTQTRLYLHGILGGGYSAELGWFSLPSLRDVPTVGRTCPSCNTQLPTSGICDWC